MKPATTRSGDVNQKQFSTEGSQIYKWERNTYEELADELRKQIAEYFKVAKDNLL